jgi:hypothetical protein
MGSLETGGKYPEPAQPQTEAATASVGCDRQALEGESVKEKGGPQENTHGGELPTERKTRKGMPRKKVVCGEREDWETRGESCSRIGRRA